MSDEQNDMTTEQVLTPEDPSKIKASGFDPGTLEVGDSYTRHFQEGPTEDTLIVNMGPQHPSTHGVLRIILELDGEYIKKAEPVLGYVHRMHEKMGENRSAAQYLPNMGRTDYLHAIAWNWAWVGAVEKLGGIEVPERAEYIRVLTNELNRITSHLLWWGAYLLDLGAFTPIMYAFQDREIAMDLLQRCTGSRLTYCYFRFGGVSADVDDVFLDGVREFVPYLRNRLPMYKALVTENLILRKRVEDVGYFSQDLCRRYGASGPVTRGSAIPYDVRRFEPFSVYDQLDFDIPIYEEGDAMARYLVRMDELEESLKIIEQCLDRIPSAQGKHIVDKAPKATYKAPAGEVYYSVEGARGAIGVLLSSDGSANPYRVKLRSPGYCNLHLFAEAAQGVLIGDAISILGSLDLVIPEIDR